MSSILRYNYPLSQHRSSKPVLKAGWTVRGSIPPRGAILMSINKILNNIIISDTGCWIWQKSCNSAGYGQLVINRKHWLAHRYSYLCHYSSLVA